MTVKLTVPASDVREADDDDEMWFPSRSSSSNAS